MDLRILQIENACTGCGACVNICPKHCLRMEPDEEGFFYPTYNATNCVGCDLCEKTCHVVTPQEHGVPNSERFFIYHSKDKVILESSSSGGGFSMFADWVLAQGGVVFGSCYNGVNERLEVCSTERMPLASMRKSKYLESFTGKSFTDIKNLLFTGRRVLYCGTPCQVRGLKQFLSETRTNTELLLTMDFACHGVPSNKSFKQFKSMFEKQGKRIIEVDFRHKDFSKHLMWHNMTLRLGFSDGSEKVFPRQSYYFYYYEPFLDNLFLRKSCYNCDIALHSDADITLGDFWGINKHRKELDDNRGMSFVSINNPKYLPLWEELSKTGFSERLPFEAVAYQYKDNRPKRAKELIKRNEFIKQINPIGYKKAILNHYGRWHTYKRLLKTKVKQFIGRQ